MGSKSKIEKSVKEDKKLKKKIKALAPIAKPKKLSKRTAKLITQEDMPTEEKKEKKRTKLGREKKRAKLGGKKKRKEAKENEDDGMGCTSLATESSPLEMQNKIENSAEPQVTVADKSEKRAKKKKKDRLSKNNNKLMKINEAVVDEVYHISSGDEDCSKGMKKWLTEYHQSRPGLDILQQRIDEFITAHEEREQKAKEDKLKNAEEGGWTVVRQHKGRKKTTDSESGIAMGSVAEAAVVDKMAKKKSKEVGIDFYRFQRRDASRNELMMLQSKFEQDRIRIKQLRAERKFKPY